MNGAALALQTRPIQRLRVQGVLAAGAQLVRDVAGQIESRSIDRLMSERRRLLRELRMGIDCARELVCFEAIQAAVDESDRALRRIIEEETGCSKASIP